MNLLDPWTLKCYAICWKLEAINDLVYYVLYMEVIILIYVYVLCMDLLINNGSNIIVSQTEPIYNVRFPLSISENNAMNISR
jgi:hypothetical protein